MGKLSIIVPVYYNEDTLKDLYADLAMKVFPKVSDYELVMVDDGSGDGSWEIMKELALKDENIVLVKLSRNFGSHAAMLAGLNHCSGDCAVIKAADLQEDSELLLEMYRKWEEGHKVVLAVRQEREEGGAQRFFAWLYYWIVRKFISAEMPKKGFDIFLIDRKVITVLSMLDEKNSAVTLQVLWCGFKPELVYYIRRARKKGHSRWTFAKKIKLIMDSMMSFSYTPIRFMSAMGGIFCCISILASVYIMVEKLVADIDVQGWTTLIVVILFTSGCIMFMLGILGEYLWRCLDAARSRPPYVLEDIVTGGQKSEKDENSAKHAK